MQAVFGFCILLLIRSSQDGLDPLQIALVVFFLSPNTKHYLHLPIYWSAQAHKSAQCNLHCVVVSVVCGGDGVSVYIRTYACIRI